MLLLQKNFSEYYAYESSCAIISFWATYENITRKILITSRVIPLTKSNKNKHASLKPYPEFNSFKKFKKKF